MDFQVINQGSIFLLSPCSAAAHDWVAEHISDDHQEWGGSIAVEPRYIGDIVAGIKADGLSVE
jgi:hypothetical protein